MVRTMDNSELLDAVGAYSSSTMDKESACECGIQDGCAQFQHCLEAKIILLEELNFTREEKRKTDEELRKTEEKLRLAHETIRKMEQAMKTINEKMERVVDEKGEIELALADIIHGHNVKKQETMQTTRLKMNKIKEYALWKEMCLQYALGAIVILVAVIIAMSRYFKCAR